MPPSLVRLLVLPALIAALAALAACGPRDNAQLPAVSDAIVAAAQQQSPDATAAQLQHGRDTMEARCTRCHSMPAVDHESAKDWPGTMKSMAKKAKASAEDQTAMLRFVLAAQAAQHKG